MELREFLDLVGLNYYDKEIKKLIKSNDAILAKSIQTLETALSATKDNLEWGDLGAE